MLSVQHLYKSYGRKSFFGDTQKQVLRDVSLHASAGAVVGLVGESGGGKSTLGRLILGLEKPDAGEILFEGLPVQHWRAANPGGMSVVFQDYATSVNSAFTIAQCIGEALTIRGYARGRENGRGKGHGKGQAAATMIAELMERVGLPAALAHCLPHEVSGGQLQRACIARAIATEPKFILFDEAVSSLDASLQTSVLDLLRDLKGDMTYLFIAHDIQSVAYFCDDVYFLHGGTVDEHLAVEALASASSAYAKRLMQSVIIFSSDWNDKAEI